MPANRHDTALRLLAPYEGRLRDDCEVARLIWGTPEPDDRHQLARYIVVTTDGEDYFAACADDLPEASENIIFQIIIESPWAPRAVLDLDEGAELDYSLRCDIQPAPVSAA